MAKAKLPPAKDWQARNISDWNAQTFLAYLRAKHEEKYSSPYIGKPIPQESKLIKNMYEQYGRELTKEFIDACFLQYRPSGEYLGVNFHFMYTYMREYALPRLLQRSRNEAAAIPTQDISAIQW